MTDERSGGAYFISVIPSRMSPTEAPAMLQHRSWTSTGELMLLNAAYTEPGPSTKPPPYRGLQRPLHPCLPRSVRCRPFVRRMKCRQSPR